MTRGAEDHVAREVVGCAHLRLDEVEADPMSSRIHLLAFVSVLGGCGGEEVSFRLLTYNIAGLPEGISQSHPERNTAMIGAKLAPYDLVLVQEDFTYHDALIAEVSHPHLSITKEPAEKLTGDGLNTISRSPFTELLREPWEVCFGGLDSGSDCLAEKGFTMATHTLAEDVEIDVYNLHCDAGGGPEDIAARSKQIDQLVDAIAARSRDKAVIVAGDTNLRASSRPVDGETLARLKTAASLTDACEATSCGEPDRIDRVFFRSSAAIEIRAESWSVEPGFVDEAGEDLSDHEPISVTIRATRA